MNLLTLEKVGKTYGKLEAVSDLDFGVAQGAIHSLIGPNGAGKTTVFNLITGMLRPTSGQIVFKGEDISRMEPHKIAQKGIARSFQQTFLFMEYSVLDNVLTGFHMRHRAGVLKEFLHTRGAREADKKATEQALEIVEFDRSARCFAEPAAGGATPRSGKKRGVPTRRSRSAPGAHRLLSRPGQASASQWRPRTKAVPPEHRKTPPVQEKRNLPTLSCTRHNRPAYRGLSL